MPAAGKTFTKCDNRWRGETLRDDNLVGQQTHGRWPDGDYYFTNLHLFFLPLLFASGDLTTDQGLIMIFTTFALLHPVQDVSIAPPVPKDFFQRTVEYYCSKTCPYV